MPLPRRKPAHGSVSCPILVMWTRPYDTRTVRDVCQPRAQVLHWESVIFSRSTIIRWHCAVSDGVRKQVLGVI